MKTLFKYSISIIVLALLLITVSFAPEAKAGTLQLGDIIPNFSLPDGITGEKINFDEDIRGKSKAIVLTFMTTTCSACKGEVSILSDLAKQHEDLKVYAICVDLNGDQTVPTYNKTFEFNVSYMLDPEFYLPKKFGFTYTPALILASGEGEILFLKGGFIEDEADEIVEAIEDALR
jgi:thiol-disulfide isomerase/thioredoxin